MLHHYNIIAQGNNKTHQFITNFIEYRLLPLHSEHLLIDILLDFVVIFEYLFGDSEHFVAGLGIVAAQDCGYLVNAG